MEELTNIPDDVHITDIFHHVTPPQVAATPELRRQLIEYYREERRKFSEEKMKGRKAKKLNNEKKAEELLGEKVG